MRIGIDIDDTICDTCEFLIPHLSEHFKVDKKLLENIDITDYNALNCTYEEYIKYVKENYKNFALNYKLKYCACEIINKLKDEGHQIIFITARSFRGFDDPYKTSFDYLKKNNIKFDKIIVNAKNKGQVCVDEKIDIFIDDSIENCISVYDKKVPVLLFNTRYNKNCNLFKRVFDWKEIYLEIEKVKNNE